ncbi:MAG: hypothetical protein V7752_09020 [Halopseudomonas sp.]
MLSKLFDEEIINDLSDIHYKNQFLIDQYAKHSSSGVPLNLCALFTSRLDGLIDIYLSSTSTKTSLLDSLHKVEQDLGDIQAFHDSLDIIRKNIELKL